MASLEAKNLSRRYRHRFVVSDLSLTTRTGEIVALLGPNGAGKTVTFEMIAGIITPSSGSVLFDGQDITRAAMFRRARLGMGYLCQQHSIFRGLSALENLTSVLEARGTNRRDAEHRAREVLHDLGLSALRDANAAILSGGEKRKLELARSLVLDPAILLLDEPFTGIDPKTIEDLHEILRGLPARGIGVLLTDHNVVETLRLCDRGYVIADGRLLASGTSSELANHPEVRARYLGEWFETASLQSSLNATAAAR